MEPTVHKLLPLDPDVFPEYEENRDKYNRDVTYVPSVKAVMDRLVPGYVKGDLFGALVESYCSEQNARMTAMKSSSDNARSMLQNLNLSYNRARQAAITQEITEVVGRRPGRIVTCLGGTLSPLDTKPPRCLRQHNGFDTPLTHARRGWLRPLRPQVKVCCAGACPAPHGFHFFDDERPKGDKIVYE